MTKTHTQERDAQLRQGERPEWTNAKRIVIKIGSSLLTDQNKGTLNASWLESLMSDIAALKKANKDVVVVSSGAIALGRHALKLAPGPLKLEESQASAATGQIHLAHAYQSLAGKNGFSAAQILLTLGDTEERRQYLNARSTITTLLKLNALPVVNENDTVATSEIRYGDNDRLAARVATMISADCLVLLSDIDGLYTAPPTKTAAGELIGTHVPLITAITPEIEQMAGDVGTELSRGGMVTKISAAKIANSAGTHMVICSGKDLHPIDALTKGARASWFLADATPLAARKRWIAGVLQPSGKITIDDGAVNALRSGRSLLPAGVLGVEGEFERGEAVIIQDQTGKELGRGLITYGAVDAVKISGQQSQHIEKLLGYRGRNELIHRDDMTLHMPTKQSEK